MPPTPTAEAMDSDGSSGMTAGPGRTASREPLLEVRGLEVRIERDTGVVRPLNGVSFRVEEGQSVAVVGESGCGKTMAANALLRILPRSSEITGGEMLFRPGRGNRPSTWRGSTRAAGRCATSAAAASR